MEHSNSPGEEIVNAVSHGIATLAAIAGFIFLMIHAEAHWQPNRFWGLFIFGVSLILLYLTSTLFHSLTFTKAYQVFKKLDYTAIALFIAGSYTPIALISLGGTSALILLSGVWILTIIGIIWRIYGRNQDKASLILYLITGWLVILFIKPLSQHMPHEALLMLIIGGLSYTIGTLFFQWRKLSYSHSIWHLLVIIGSICHFYTMMHI